MKQKNKRKHMTLHHQAKQGYKTWLRIACPTIRQIIEAGEETIACCDDHKHVLTLAGTTGKESLFHAFIINYRPPTCEAVILDRLECDALAMREDTWNVTVDKPALPLIEMRVSDLAEGSLAIVAGSVMVSKKRKDAKEPCFEKLHEPGTCHTVKPDRTVWAVDMKRVKILEHEPEILTITT